MRAKPGIASVEDVRSRCFVDEGGCWNWRLAHNSFGTPQAWFPQRHMTTSVASILHVLCKGKTVPKGKLWRPPCENRWCVNPEHQVYVTRSALITGQRRAPALHAYNATVARRARSDMTAERAEEVREADGTLKQIMAAFGLSRSQVCRIRSGQAWRPLAIPGASVFNFGG